jgi:hypothetical protein
VGSGGIGQRRHEMIEAMAGARSFSGQITSIVGIDRCL